MMSFRGRRAPVLAGVVALLAMLVVHRLVPAPFERLRLAVADEFQRLSPRVRTMDRVLVVDVDEESLKRYGQWPWSRQQVADVVRGLQDLGARAIGLDMIFAEPDRTSPARLLPEWRATFGFQGGAANLPDYDRMLADALARGQVALGMLLQAEPNGVRPSNLTGIASLAGPTPPGVARYGGALLNIPLLDAAAAGHGSITVAGGADEINRRMAMVTRLGDPLDPSPATPTRDRLVPSLAVEVLRLFLAADELKLRAEAWNGQLSGYTLRIGDDLDLPLDPTGALWLHYPEPMSTLTVPAWQVLDAATREALRPRIRGAAVLVGTSARGLSDLRPTPLSAFEPGVNLHAGVIEQALERRFLTRPPWAGALEVGFAVVLAVGVAVSAALGAQPLAAAVAFSGIGLGALACLGLFAGPGLLFDPSLPTFLVVAAWLAASVARYAQTDRAAQQLRIAFTHYLSPALVTALVTHPERLKLGGEAREMTFLFTDLEGFTSLTEQAGAEALVSLLNDYLDNLCRIAMEHGGTVDKIVGDAVHVMFNAPLDQPDHAARAVACAMAIDAFATGFAAEQQRSGVAFGATRVGVNTGRAVVGNFGGSRRFDYTAHGDAINTAARLEAANKTLGTRICVARRTMVQAPGHLFRPLGALMLKGKSEAVDVFEPLADPGRRDEVERFAAALDRLAAGDPAAGGDLLLLHAARPDDPLLALYARRIGSGEWSGRIAA